MASQKLLGVAAGLLLMMASGTALAEEEELPELDFLEYLGDWEVEDEEWLDPLEVAEIVGEEWPDPGEQPESGAKDDDES